LTQLGPSHVLFFIVSKTVILFLDHINKNISSGINPIYSILLCDNILLIGFPPMFNMGESLQEYEGDLFPIRKIVNREITL
jgi:hypothetical protein